MKVSLQRAIASLTSALDFVGVDEVHHGKRVALMAASIAGELGWDKSRCSRMLYAGMLHDCGVARCLEHRQLTATLEWEGAEEHCLRGEQYLQECPPLAHFAPVVRWHHTRWQALCEMAMPDAERMEANLIFLADRTDVLLAPYVSGGILRNDVLWEYPGIVDRLAGLAGLLFSAELVDAFRRAAKREAFWLRMDPSYIGYEIEDRIQDDVPTELGGTDALAIAKLFARTTDSKSLYTLEHSTRVASLARYLAGVAGIDGDEAIKIEIAALLHDIGKLRVPEEIIDKPAAITPEERAIVKRHSFDTGWILRKVFPGEPIADWASMHHEDLLGTGYPSQLAGKALPREARLIAVADIFQALSQERPYRGRLSSSEVMDVLDGMAARGRVDGQMVEHVRQHLDVCYSLAVD